MNLKLRWKIAIDVLMSILLLLLMAYQVIGEFWHEVCGGMMLALFFAHHALNIRWYGNLFKGRYTAQRMIGTVLNAALLAVMLSLAYSGIILSRHVFGFVKVTKGMALSRVMHMSASYWGFLLMSAHIGFHWSMVMRISRKFAKEKRQAAVLWVLRMVAVAIAVYGTVCFWQANSISYMFVNAEFVFFDYDKSTALVFAQQAAIMEFGIFISYYMSKGIGKLVAEKRKKKALYSNAGLD